MSKIIVIDIGGKPTEKEVSVKKPNIENVKQNLALDMLDQALEQLNKIKEYKESEKSNLQAKLKDIEEWEQFCEREAKKQAEQENSALEQEILKVLNEGTSENMKKKINHCCDCCETYGCDDCHCGCDCGCHHKTESKSEDKSIGLEALLKILFE